MNNGKTREGSDSKKHHYLPRFYLNGFTDNQNEFYVFDKVKEKIRKSKPDNSFYEKYRNTAYGKDRVAKTNILEDMYARYDNRASMVFKEVRNSKLNDPVLTPHNLTILRLFIINLFWRIPSHDKLLDFLIDTNSFKELGFEFVNKSNEGSVGKDFEEDLKKIEAWRKMYRVIVPHLSSRKEFQKANYENWKLMYRPQEYNITGDNPIVMYSFKDFSSLNEELLFPISKNITLCNTKKKIPSSLPPKFNLLTDVLILLNSKRFVCCLDKTYLELIVNKFYSKAKGKGIERHILDGIFGHFED